VCFIEIPVCLSLHIGSGCIVERPNFSWISAATIARTSGIGANTKRKRARSAGAISGDDLDDAHHPLVLVVDGVAVIDEAANDHRVGEGDDDF
jgi:hypothetical protein